LQGIPAKGKVVSLKAFPFAIILIILTKT